MKRNFPWVLAVGLFLLLLSLYANAGVEAGQVNIVDYLACGEDGDQWTYNYAVPPGTAGFTVSMIKLTDGDYAGKYRMGDWRDPDGSTEWYIIDSDASHIYLYYHNQLGDFNPRLVVEGWQELEKPILNPFNQDTDNPLYLKTLASLTVTAGTFRDILIYIALDKNHPPNKYNDLYKLDRQAVPWGVTHIEWYARGFGQIADEDVDAATGNQVFKFDLVSTTAKPKLKAPVPASLLLLLEN
jgi:hypothetical protein